MSRAKRWVFTLNNPTAEEEQSLVDAANNPRHVEYLVWGRERGTEGDTPHFQGFVIFKAAVRFTTVKNRLGSARYHLEVAKGTDQQAADYCKKDGDYEEYGELPPVTQGTRTDLQSFFDWCTEEGNRLGRPVTHGGRWSTSSTEHWR